MTAEGRRRVCVATTMPGYEHARVLDWALAQALDLRGAEVDFLVCDKALPVCQMAKSGRITAEQIAANNRMSFCEKCVGCGKSHLAPLGYPMRRLVDFLDESQIAQAAEIAQSTPFADIAALSLDGLAVGDHAQAGALRFFARGNLEGEAFAEPVLRRFLEAGLLTVFAMRRLLEAHKYDVIVVNHGIYIPQGMIVEVAREAGVRVVTYNPAYRKHSFTFSHGQSYHFTMLEEPSEHWMDFQWSDQRARETSGYLDSRRSGANDWIWFHDKPKEDIRAVLSDLGADPDRPHVALLTSVVWDAQLHYKASAYPSMMDWIIDTVEHWARRSDDLQLIIRVHPAEVRGAVPSRQCVVDELACAFPELPRNVFVLPPDDQASTYALCEAADCVLIYNTKAGAEIAPLGVPVVVAGEAWIRGKGIARDVSSPADYLSVLEGLPVRARLSEAQRNQAMRYAYHFFFRRMIPLPFISQDAGATFKLDFRDRSDLAPGKWPGLDAICDGILSGAPFVYKAELLQDPFPGEST